MAVVKAGEFELVKHTLEGLDDKILDLLHRSNLKKELAKKVMLLRGRESIYKKSHAFISGQATSADGEVTADALCSELGIDVDEIASAEVQEKIRRLAYEQASTTAQKNAGSLNTVHPNMHTAYKDIVVKIVGAGALFGAQEAALGQDKYHFGLRSHRDGSTYCLLHRSGWQRFLHGWGAKQEEAKALAAGRQQGWLDELTKRVIAKWYTNHVLENQKVVHVTDEAPPKKVKHATTNSKDLIQAKMAHYQAEAEDV